MKTTKSKITKLIQEVTQEILHEYENTELDKYRIFFVDKKTGQSASYVVTLDPQFEDVKSYNDDIINQAKSKGLDLEVDQNKKPQFIGTVRVDDEGGEYNESKTVREHLAQVVPNRQMEEGGESPLHKNLPGSDKWKDISGANPQKPVSSDIKRFSQEVSDKLRSKFAMTGELVVSRLCDAVRQMIEHKMKKEGWQVRPPEYND